MIYQVSHDKYVLLLQQKACNSLLNIETDSLILADYVLTK